MENFIFLCSEISASPEAYLRPCEISMMDSYCENIGQYLLVCSLCKNGVISDVYGNIYPEDRQSKLNPHEKFI